MPSFTGLQDLLKQYKHVRHQPCSDHGSLPDAGGHRGEFKSHQHR